MGRLRSDQGDPGIARSAVKHERGRVALHETKEVAMSESTQDRPDAADEVDDPATKPGEQDTETEAGFPESPPDSKDSEQSKPND